MWFKYGLKVQKLLAQGNTLGFSKILAMRPVRAKALKRGNGKAFALTGRRCCLHVYPGCYPGLGASALSGRVGQTVTGRVGANFSRKSKRIR